MTVAKLMQNGELRVKGVDTRSPLVTDGLVAHYPMDGTTKGIANNNILDYSTWVVGSSQSQTGFSANGDGNSIIEDFGPFGEYQPIWQALGNDTTSDDDGGWNSNSFAIDRTKKYRHSVWIRRKVTGNGTGYFGCLGSSVYNIAANTVNTNPYFWASTFPNNDWLLFVSYVYPSDIGNVVPTDDAGIYNTAKTKLSSIGTFKFSPTATTNNHRTYLYYSTLATTNQQWAYPRVDLCDGTEPSLDDLLSGEGNVINPYSESSITITNDYVGIEEATTNILAYPHNTFSEGNGHGTYHTGTTYNNNTAFSIGTVGSVSGNIVTLSSVGHIIYTYDCIRPQTTGGGLTAGTNYFIKKLSDTTFSVHSYDSSQDGSKGYAVHDSINNDVKISINATGFPTSWLGGAHVPNQGLVKEIIKNGYREYDTVYDCLRLHKEHRISTGGSDSFMAYGIPLVVVGGQTYTFSYKVRAVNNYSVGSSIGLSMYTAGNWPNSTSITLTKEWQTLTLTSVAPNSGTTYTYFSNTARTTVDIACLQVEQKAFATEFVNGSRSASGDLKYPVTLANNATISFDYFCKERISNTVISNSQYNYWWGLYLNSSGYLYTHEGHDGSSHTSSYLMPLNTWVNITIKWNDTTQYYYVDGILVGSIATVGSANSANIPIISLGYGWNIGNALFKNLSIYNRALSDDEVKKLAKGTHTFTQDELITNGINSRPNIPSDAFYYPLDLNAKDEYNLYLPSEDIGNYADGLYVGSGNSVEYNFNSSLGLDWNGDWSICYFKKPIGTHLGETNLTGYNIESFGSNGNTVGGGYLWFGKLNLSNSIEGASNGAFAPDVYFNNWQCVTIIKSGTSVTISTWLTDKISRDRTVVLGTISSNRFVTQYGYDFKLSGWDNTNPCYSYFRDLIVVKRAITSDELKNYRNVKMKATSDELYIQNGINSTATL